MTLDRFAVIKIFLDEHFPRLVLDDWTDGGRQVRMLMKKEGRPIISVYDDTIFFICAQSDKEKPEKKLSFGRRWGRQWNRVEINMAHIDFFDVLTKAVKTAIKNMETYD